VDDRRFQPRSMARRRPLVAAGAMAGLAAWITFALAGFVGAMIDGLSHGVVWAALLVLARPFVDDLLRPALGERAKLVSSICWLGLVPGVVLLTFIHAIEPPLVGGESGAGFALTGGPIAFVLVAVYSVADYVASLSLDRHPILGRVTAWLLGAACVGVVVALAFGAWRALHHPAPSAYLASLPEVSRVADRGMAPVSRTRAARIDAQGGYQSRAALAGTSLEAHRACRSGSCEVSLVRSEPSRSFAGGPIRASDAVKLPYVGELSLRSDEQNQLWVLLSDDRSLAAYHQASLERSDVTVSKIAASLSPERDWLWAALAGLGLAAFELRRRRQDERVLRAIEAGREATAGPGPWLSFTDGSGSERADADSPACAPGERVVVLGGSRSGAYRGGPDGQLSIARGTRAAAAGEVRDRLVAQQAAALASLLLMAAPLMTAVLVGLVL
jgi:hypothetical protein